MSRACLSVVATCLALLPSLAHADDAPPDREAMRARYAAADAAGDPALDTLVADVRVRPQWIEGGPAFWYARPSGVPGSRWKRVDPAAGTVEDLDARPDASPATPSKGPAAKRPWPRVRLVGGRLRWIAGPDADPEPLEEDAPDTGSFRRLTVLPGGRHAVVWSVQEVPAAPMTVLDSRVHPERMRPGVATHPYALPGDAISTYRGHVVDIARRRLHELRQPPIDHFGPPEVHPVDEGRAFLYVQVHRGHRRKRVVRVDVGGNRSRVLLDEKPGWMLPPDKHLFRLLPDGRRFLWTSEKDGWNHLHLHDARTGRHLRQLTKGPWVVRGVDGLDADRNEVRFRASGREANQDPYHVHHYVVGLDGKGLTCVTPEDGTHDVTWSPDGAFLVDRYQRVDLPPVTELRRRDGTLIQVLERSSLDALQARGWRAPERIQAPGRDGETPIWGTVFRPRSHDPAQTRAHPILEHIYAGPHGAFAPIHFSARHRLQAWAELGFVVVQIDGMGTSKRSRAFHAKADRNLADSGFPDRIVWMQALAARDASVDLDRVGIFGHSAGGYNAARALIDHPEHYRAAVALAGNHDHRTDKRWWNECWMDWPLGPHYATQSNIDQAHRLQGALYLIHGEADRNVNAFASTVRFADALMKANKDFDFLLVPGAGHGLSQPYVQRRMRDFFVRHLLDATPPDAWRIRTPDGSCHIRIHNHRDTPVEILWLPDAGAAKRYHTLAPGGTVTQHTFFGHAWEARVEGRPVGSFAARPGHITWDIR